MPAPQLAAGQKESTRRDRYLGKDVKKGN